jgi:hypothetical protein
MIIYSTIQRLKKNSVIYALYIKITVYLCSINFLTMDQSCEAKKKPKTFKEFIKSSWFLKPLLATVIGGAAGYLYYHFVGCSSGSCGITSNPYLSTIAGGVMGFFVVSSPCSKC